MFCTRCGKEFEQSLGFCPVCGQDVQQGSVAVPPASPAMELHPSTPPEAQPQAQLSAYPSAGPRGVGGWLLFFCIAFAIVWPLWSMSRYFQMAFVRSYVFSPLVWAGLLSTVLECVTGIVLWMQKPIAMMLLRVYFLVRGILTLAGIAQIVRSVGRYHSDYYWMQLLFGGFSFSLIFFVASLLYFAMAPRVRATYGSNLLG